MNFAAPAPQPPNAIVAHDFAATDATIGASNTRMPRTYQRAIRQDHRRSGSRWDVKTRNADADISGFRNKFDLPKTQRMAGAEFCLANGNRLSINESAVGRIAIPHYQRVADHFNFAMEARNGGMFDLKIGVGTAPETIGSKLQFQHATLKSLGFHQ